MNLRKSAAIAVSAGVLGLQAYMVFPPGWYSRKRYWPFLDYPMYSDAHGADAAFSSYELRLGGCGAATTAPASPASADDVDLERFVYWHLLETAAGAGPAVPPSPEERARAERTLFSVARTYRPDTCKVEIWVRTYRLAEVARGAPHPPWTLARGWRLDFGAPAAGSSGKVGP